MKVNEIFVSLQGEGLNTGLPTTFIRLHGCNLSCGWCDTPEAKGIRPYTCKTIQEIADAVTVNRVCITGGEPLLQQGPLGTLVQQLVNRGRRIEVFTNGTIAIPEWAGLVSWVVDVKCPSTGLRVLTYPLKWLPFMTSSSVLKFTVADERDLTYVLDTLKTARTQGTVIVSPVIVQDNFIWRRMWLQRVWGFCVEHNLRYGLQIHKAVFGNKKGV